MTKNTILTLFSGGELAGVGARAAGFEHIGGVEYDPAIAEVAKANGFDLTVKDIRKVKPSQFDRPTLLHASPVCTRASQANPNAGEAALDIESAQKVSEFIRAMKPRFFTMENVIAYRHFKSFEIILSALSNAGYMFTVEHLNAADFGVPQTRRRLFVRAVRGGFVPYLPQPVPWVGWYEAIEDLLDSLPETEFAAWQIARLPDHIAENFIARPAKGNPKTERGNIYRKADQPMHTIKTQNPYAKAFIFSGAGNTNLKEAEPGKGVRFDTEPVHTIAASGNGGRTMKAFLVSGQNSKNNITYGNEPMPTVTASQRAAHRAWLKKGHVVKMTPRALARFQSVPDNYELPEVATLSGKVIGNGVPSKLYQTIAEAFI